jgi:hypothetical protein
VCDTALTCRESEAQVRQKTREADRDVQRPESCKSRWRRHRGRPQPGEIEAESGRDRERHSPSLTGISWEELRKKNQIFKNFQKSKNAGNCLKSAQNPNFFEKFQKNFNVKFYNFFVLCALCTISSIF